MKVFFAAIAITNLCFFVYWVFQPEYNAYFVGLNAGYVLLFSWLAIKKS